MSSPEAYVVHEKVLIIRVEEQDYIDTDDYDPQISLDDPRLDGPIEFDPEGDAYLPDVTVGIY